MIYLSIILCIVLFLISLSCSKNNLFSPGVITSGIWLICLCLSLILTHNLPPLSGKFFGALTIWIITLTFFSLLMQVCKFHVSATVPHQSIRDIYWIISVFTYPFLIFFAYQAIETGTSGNWALDLRLATLGKTATFKESYGPVYVTIWLASYLIELMFFSQKNRHRVFILGFFYFSFAIIAMAKFILLQLFLMTICILYFKKVIKIKHILIGIYTLIGLFIILQIVRHSSGAFTINNFLVLYTVGNMNAFETLEPCSSSYFGENIFRIFYVFANKLNLSTIEPVNTLLPFIEKPIFTNTYTGFYPFFKDFGYWGIGIFAALLGSFYGWLFKKAQQKDPLCILLYSYFSFSILMQFVGDTFFTMIAGNIKTIIFIFLPFFISKYKLFRIK